MPDERAILLQLYDAAGGPHWRAKQRWLKGPNACRWHGIECDGDGFVTSIDLGGNGVRGALPDALSTLARLRTLNIDESRLSGTLPPLSHLHSLKVLLLASNPALSGTLPPHATLNNLEELDLSRTRVSGTIGSATGQLRALRRLQLNHAAISGTVPSQIGMLARAEAIFAHESTALSGTLPSEIGRLAPTLRLGMSLASTRLSGSIPSQLGGLSRLRALWLVHTRLSGTLPPSIGAMRSLAELELHANRISGALPTQLGALRPTLRRCVRAVARIRTLSSPLLSACRSHHVCVCASGHGASSTLQVLTAAQGPHQAFHSMRPADAPQPDTNRFDCPLPAELPAPCQPHLKCAAAEAPTRGPPSSADSRDAHPGRLRRGRGRARRGETREREPGG